MVQMNGANVASPVRIVTEQSPSNQQQPQQQQQQQQQQQTQQGMILATAGNGTQTSGQKVVQLIMAQPPSGNNRVIGKISETTSIYM